MKKKKVLLASMTGIFALTVTAFSVIVGVNNGEGFEKMLGSVEKVTWNHYSAVSPSFAEKGIKEYWVSCESHEHQFTAPTGDVEIVDIGTPSKSFINSLEADDDRLLARFNDMDINFEDDLYENFISSPLSCSLSTEQAFNGTHSLKIVNNSGDQAKAFFISNEYYDALPAEGIAFRIYCDTAFNGYMVSGATQTYNGGHSIDNSNIKYWNPLNAWKDYIVPKSSISSGSNNHYIFKIANGISLYIDDIRPAYADSDFVGFEDDRSLTKVLAYSSNTNAITEEKAHSGKKSLKVVYGVNNRTFLLSDEFYNALPEEGITFNVYSEGIFNGGTWHYFDPAGEWKEVTVAKSAINSTAGDHYVGTLWSNATFYIDDLRPANFLSGKTATSFDEDYSTRLAYAESRNTSAIVAGTACDGSRSLKINVTSSWNKGFLLSDELYAALPDEGIKFSLLCENGIFNANTNGGPSLHYYSDAKGTWKEFIVAKANINSTAGDHWVCTIGAAVTIYIDNVRPATAA